MADGYYGYNPADYLKDYSWIGDIGQTVAQFAHKMPEIVKFNQSVKQNRQHNTETHMAMQEWVKWMSTEDPEVWNAVAKGYGVEPGQLKGILTGQLRAPQENEQNEKYTRAVFNDFAIPLMRAGNQGGLTSDAFVRGLSRMPRVIESGERQGELMKERQEQTQKRKRLELEQAKAGIKTQEVRAKQEDVLLAEEAVAKQRGMAGAGIIPPEEATRGRALEAVSAVRPGATARPEVRSIAAGLPTEMQVAAAGRAEAAGGRAGETKQYTSSSIEATIGRQQQQIRHNESVIVTNNKLIRTLDQEIVEGKKKFGAQKLTPADERALRADIDKAKKEIEAREKENIKLAPQLDLDKLALKEFTRLGGTMHPETLKNRVRKEVSAGIYGTPQSFFYEKGAAPVPQAPPEPLSPFIARPPTAAPAGAGGRASQFWTTP